MKLRCASLSSSAGARAQDVVRIAVGVDPVYTPWWIADRQGFFKKYGIQAEFTRFSGGPDLADAVLAGNADEEADDFLCAPDGVQRRRFAAAAIGESNRIFAQQRCQRGDIAARRRFAKGGQEFCVPARRCRRGRALVANRAAGTCCQLPAGGFAAVEHLGYLRKRLVEHVVQEERCALQGR